jgi:transposase
MLAKIRRMHLRDGMSLREVSKRTGLSRNTVRSWMRRPQVVEPMYPPRKAASKLDGWTEVLQTWLRTDSHRARRERRTAKVLFQAIRAQGYVGGYGRVCAFVRRWKAEQADAPKRAAYVPLAFELGEAFQFDWSCEYAFVAGLRRRLEVAHTKLAASRAFWLVAYPSQSHEMLFDAHARAFTAFGGVPRRGIYDNMKTAVDRVGRGKERTVNVRFQAMCSHYLFEPEFCNRAAGWEKGIVEKNVQDRRRQIWHEVAERRWVNLEELNRWLAERCRADWEEMRHPQWSELSIAELLQDEQARLMPLPRAFDGYIEQPVRVSATGLIHVQRNRYSVPTEYAHRVVSLRVYPFELVVVAEGREVARHVRSFEREQTFYDWRHYISLIVKKPGALRNGAPFATMPEPLVRLQGCLLKHPGGDRVMAQVLAAVPVHGLEAVLVAAEIALESGRPSGEHVMNVLARLKSTPVAPVAEMPGMPLTLAEEPAADVGRYEQLRSAPDAERTHVD